jgi:ribosomal protein S18 acetylase RimI-like enzyme
VIVERASEASGELVEAFARLIPQLSPQRPPPTREDLEELLTAPGTTVFVARDGAGIVGTLTLVVYGIPTGLRGLIEDVVVDEASRGKGVGEALVVEALQLATEAGAHAVSLTSRPEREAANRLYRRLGFELRETNVYAWWPSAGR